MDMAARVCIRARIDPHKTALVDERDEYTFGELGAASDNVARFLLSRGLQRGDRVVFCAPKTARLVVAILGCLKAGGIYVPLDPKAPRLRIQAILDDIRPRLVVACAAAYEVEAGELDSATAWIDVNDLDACFDHEATELVTPAIAAEDIAYCIYTSGSTGRPKGVLIEHGSVDVLFEALLDVMPIGPESRCMNTSELYFDVHVMDLFYPLHRGATVHIASAPMIADKLLQTLQGQAITHFTAVGPLMTLITQGSLFDSCDLSSVERVMTGAEVLNVGTMQKWLEKVPGLSLVNGYGPTEATVICTSYVIDRPEPGRTELYPIGTALPGTEVALVDGGRIVSDSGVEGELLIAGPQVMKGYWDDEEQTAEKIVDIGGKRWYRSGDVCRWRRDGNLDYVGRVDEQVKLSGFRIDLAEIKRVMDAAPGIEEGHPVVTDHPVLGKVVAACFISCADVASVTGTFFSEVQAAFKRELPYYMVPSLYLLFDRFPRLPSGKTDRKQLRVEVDRRIEEAGLGTTRFVCQEVGA